MYNKNETNGKGQHHDCDVVPIQDIKEEKKAKLNNNIKCLENLSEKLEEYIKKLKLF